MSKEIALDQMCIVMRGGLEMWVSKDRAEKIKTLMESQKYIEIDGSTIATFDITGILTPQHMEEKTRKTNGQYKCLKGNWHDRYQNCDCRTKKGTRKGFVEGVGEVEIAEF